MTVGNGIVSVEEPGSIVASVLRRSFIGDVKDLDRMTAGAQIGYVAGNMNRYRASHGFHVSDASWGMRISDIDDLHGIAVISHVGQRADNIDIDCASRRIKCAKHMRLGWVRNIDDEKARRTVSDEE